MTTLRSHAERAVFPGWSEPRLTRRIAWLCICRMHPILRLVSRRGALLTASFAITGCNLPVSLTPMGQHVEVSDEHMVQACQYLGDVSGDSTDTDTARNDARNSASKQGATNIVFVSQSNGVVTPGKYDPNTPANAMGRAYRCAPSAAPPGSAAPAPASPAAPAAPAKSS